MLAILPGVLHKLEQKHKGQTMKIVDHQADYQAAALYALEVKQDYLRALAEVGRVAAQAQGAGIALDKDGPDYLLSKGEALAAFLGDLLDQETGKGKQ